MSDQKGKKRKKAFYINSARKKRFSLDAGMRGFLITCNNREKEAVKEAYNLLNEYADKLYGPEQRDERKAASSGEEEEDIEDALKKEVKSLQAETSGERPRRFQVVDTNTHNCVFIKTSVEDPCELAYAIFSDIAETGKQKSRFILRMMPISTTCRATEESINKSAEQFLDTYFGYTESGRSYSILFKARNNSRVNRMSVINLFGRLVSDMNPTNRADLKNPDLAIVVDVVCKVCCLTVVKNYAKFKRFNLLEMAKREETNSRVTVTTDLKTGEDETSAQQLPVTSDPHTDEPETDSKNGCHDTCMDNAKQDCEKQSVSEDKVAEPDENSKSVEKDDSDAIECTS